MKLHLLDPREQLVTIMNRIYLGDMTTLSGGNLSLKDNNGNIWITPAGVDKGNLSADDIMCVRANGSIEGPHKPSSEYPFHHAIYQQRPDFKAVVHAHPPALVAFSIARQIPDTSFIPDGQRICGPVGYAPYALPGSKALGTTIAATFAQGYNVVLLENHGIVTGGTDLLEAFQRLETLDFCCRTLLGVRRLGANLIPHRGQQPPFDTLPAEFVPETPSEAEQKLRALVAAIVRRACQRQLVTSAQGVVSARLDAASFLITPCDADHYSLDPEDIVLIRSGQRERGKFPSQSVGLHQAIYKAQPGIHSVMTAQSPYAMAFAISDARFDTKTIPESYILLRDMPLIPQNSDPVSCLSERTPIILIQNNQVLSTGNSVLQAFDRLEVAEFSARALIDTGSIGSLCPIGNCDVDDLKTAFGLS